MYILSNTGKDKTGEDKMKKYTIIAIITIGVIMGFLTGIYIYKINKIDSQQKEYIAEEVEDECTAIGELNGEEIANLIITNSEEEKTSPNCVITLKIYHEACEHLIESRQSIEEADVNMTEEELKKRFSDWEVQKFTPTEIVLYKEVEEFCNEHYLLKEEDGYIVIYKLDENDNAEFFNATQIPTEYLAEEDLEQIKNGMKVYTDVELNKTLEDFE